MMIRALWTGATGMMAQQQNIDSIANDLSNVNTYGYKKRHLNFQDLYYQTLRASGVQGSQAGNNVPVGVQIGNGVRLAAVTPVFIRGNPQQTDLWSNLMIDDDRTFFGVTLPNGQRAYTRDGSFRVNNNGELRTVDGLALDPPIAGIPNPAPNLTVSSSGMVQYTDPTTGNPVNVGQIQTYGFVNQGGLSAMGQNFWRETAASGPPQQGIPDVAAGHGPVRSGWLETSNVNAITEMVNMISAQRAYEFNSRSIQTSDEMLQTVNALKR